MSLDYNEAPQLPATSTPTSAPWQAESTECPKGEAQGKDGGDDNPEAALARS